MSTYVTLCQFTEHGARNIKDTVTRAREIGAAVEKAGGKITFYWTQGRYDLIAVAEGSEELAMLTTLNTAKSGYIRTETLRAFAGEEMERFLKKLP